MALRDRLRRLTRAAEREMISFQLQDGTTARFYESECLEMIVREWERGRRHFEGKEPGPPHGIISALRNVSDEELVRVMSEHGMLIGHLAEEDRVMRGERERPGPPVRETSPGVHE
jgi:hypothetical protein